MKHLEIGDGISFGKSHPEQAKEVSVMLEELGYKQYLPPSQRIFGKEQYFYWDGEHWLSCNNHNVKNDLSFDQIKAKASGVINLQYEIY